MKKLLLTLLLSSSVTASAHQLVHQDGHGGGRICRMSVGPINLGEDEIYDWWQLYFGANGDLVDISNLPENASTDADTDMSDDCSFYAEPIDGRITPTCGEVDHFMMAAQAAAQYCDENFGAIPFFTGPETFMQSMDEATLGSHHKEYDTNEGISFMCLSECVITDEDVL